jgi:hypothetical protein
MFNPRYELRAGDLPAGNLRIAELCTAGASGADAAGM